MQFIAHRGYWLQPAEKNSEQAFLRALTHNFGIETDFRDHNGRLVVSHDPASDSAMPASDFAQLYQAHPVSAPIALNIKADGLSTWVIDFIKQSKIRNYFAFDMSVPEMRPYLTKKIPIYTRLSEHEKHPALLDQVAGVWLDAFESQWYDNTLINDLLTKKKHIAFVSPELHGREHLTFWQFLRRSNLHLHETISLCTDFPLEARDFFHGTN
jgi:glycerophosphoryl diester phosphodiesterase